MKVKVIESKAKEERPFPKLMEGDGGSLVLMNSKGEGTLLRAGTVLRELGEYSNEWFMACFKDFEGKLELSNK